MSKPLEFTGERFTPECVREIWYEHVHRYAFAARLVEDKIVLDAACGEGYGAAYLARTAKSVNAVDISEAAVDHARERYRAINLSFQVADCCKLPFEDQQFDSVTSFETLEHLADQSGLVKEFRRVLKPDGFLIISSPDKAVYTDRHHNENEFHVKELYRDELVDLLAEQFPAQRLLKQKLAFHSAIWADERQGPKPAGAIFQQSGGQEILEYSLPRQEAMYFIALCAASESAIPALEADAWLFDDETESVYEHYHHEIRKNMSAGGVIASLEAEIEQLRNQLKTQSPPASVSWWRRLFRGL